MPSPGYTLTLNLEPSDLLPAKTNQLSFKAVATLGGIAVPGFIASEGVNVAPIASGTIFQHNSPTNIRISPQAVEFLVVLQYK